PMAGRPGPRRQDHHRHRPPRRAAASPPARRGRRRTRRGSLQGPRRRSREVGRREPVRRLPIHVDREGAPMMIGLRSAAAATAAALLVPFAAGSAAPATVARPGVASVVVDRIGYGRSGRPPGTQSCIGAQADVAHQIVQELRSGSYALEGGVALRFVRVALAGHSAGGAITQIEAYSFHDVDGVVVLSYADLRPSLRTLAALTQAGVVCLGGGNPPGHAPFGQSDADFQALMFHDADPKVVAAVTAMPNPEPCGDDASLLSAIATA